MSSIFRSRLHLLFVTFLSVLLIACSDSNNNNNKNNPVDPELTYQADIVWTEYGIPHITAQDWGSLGYGSGYALAKENYCVLMKEYVWAKGESARYLGDEGDIDSDFVYKMLNSDERIQRMIDGVPEHIVELSEGYAAGLNRYLAETGVDNLTDGEEGCRGAEWVRDVDVMDVTRVLHKLVMLASSVRLVDFIAAAEPPEILAMESVSPDVEELLATLDRDRFIAGMDMPESEEIGSNAYAVGGEASQNSTGILFGNPHFPWQGSLRFFMSHLTMGEEYDVMGMAVFGAPVNIIGFTQNHAWSHTVSTGSRFTFYELELNPDNLLQYIYDGEVRDLEPYGVSAERKLADGSIETVEHTFYLSHFGPVLDLGAVLPLLGGWPNVLDTLLVYRDANLENNRVLEQWVHMGQAENMADFKDTLRPIGIPLLNTIAADRYGDAFYGDVSVKPHVSEVKFNNCVRGFLQPTLTDMGFLTMDGSDPNCEWGSDEGTAEGILGYDNLPKLETREYAANANDSYWLPNPRNLLEGFSPVIGEERVEQNLRPRQTFDQAERRLAGTDGLGEPGFNIDNIRQLHYQATNYTAQLIVDDVVEICSGVYDWSAYADDADTIEEACDVLADWDKSHRLDSVGAHIFYEFWQRVSDTEELWAVPFDAADPVNTPRDLNTGNGSVVEAVKQSLADGAARLVEAGIPMDRPWGEIQYVEKNGERYGIHGGSGFMMFSAIASDLIDGEGYSNITAGNSYIQAVTWDESDCPDAYAILTYSQSTDPASDHYADATELYSNSGWIDMPFCEGDRDAQEIGRESISE